MTITCRGAVTVAALSFLLLTIPVYPIAAVNDQYPSEDDYVPIDAPPRLIAQVPVSKPCGADSSIAKPWVTVLVNTQGTVVKAHIGKSSGLADLDRQALKAAFGCKFDPASYNNRPVACWITYRAEFSASHPPEEPSEDTT